MFMDFKKLLKVLTFWNFVCLFVIFMSRLVWFKFEVHGLLIANVSMPNWSPSNICLNYIPLLSNFHRNVKSSTYFWAICCNFLKFYVFTVVTNISQRFVTYCEIFCETLRFVYTKARKCECKSVVFTRFMTLVPCQRLQRQIKPVRYNLDISFCLKKYAEMTTKRSQKNSLSSALSPNVK